MTSNNTGRAFTKVDGCYNIVVSVIVKDRAGLYSVINSFAEN